MNMLSTNLREQSSIMARLLHLIDCFVVVGFLRLLLIWYRVPWTPYYTRFAIITFGLCLVTFQSFQLYRSWRGWKFFQEFTVILRAWATVVGLLLFYFFVFKISHAYSRVIFLIWSLATPVLLFSMHVFARKILHCFRSNGKNVRHAVVAGAGDLGVSLARELETIPWAGIDVIGFFDDKVNESEELKGMGKTILGDITTLPGYLESNDIDYVYIALPMRAEKKIFKILRECRSLGARIYLVPDLYVYGLHHAEMQSLGSLLVLNFNPNTEWKRSFDVIFSSLVLVCLSPLFFIIAWFVKFQDGGPIFYKHPRITSAGKEFGCLKFRSMVVGADEQLEQLLADNPKLRKEWESSFKLQNDPRVTKLGKFLRKTSLDELPQFINVFKGEMSVVGARPIVGKELKDFYKESAGRYCSMKPGITGAWQVDRRSDGSSYDERVGMDDWYILNYSLWTDIKIIFKTIKRVFDGRGAV